MGGGGAVLLSTSSTPLSLLLVVMVTFSNLDAKFRTELVPLSLLLLFPFSEPSLLVPVPGPF